MQTPTTTPPHTPLRRPDSDEELTVSSYSASSVRNAIEMACQTRERIRQSRASLKLMREEARQAIREARCIRDEMQGFRVDGDDSSDDDYDLPSQATPSMASTVSELTYDYSP